MPVVKIEYIALFCTLVGTTGLGIGHHIRNTRQFPDKGRVVTGRYQKPALAMNDAPLYIAPTIFRLSSAFLTTGQTSSAAGVSHP